MEFAVEDLQEHMMFLTRRMDSFDLQYALMLVLLELGIPTNYLGFDYIRKAVTYVYSRQGDANACEAYAVVVSQSRCDCDEKQVEQTIRYAVKALGSAGVKCAGGATSPWMKAGRCRGHPIRNLFPDCM